MVNEEVYFEERQFGGINPPTVSQRNFSSIPADEHIAPAVLHCVKGHSYSAGVDV